MLEEKYAQLIGAIAHCVNTGNALLKSDLCPANAFLLEAEQKNKVEKAG